MRCLVLVPVNWCQVVQAPWHVFLLGKNHDKTDFVYRMLAALTVISFISRIERVFVHRIMSAVANI